MAKDTVSGHQLKSQIARFVTRHLPDMGAVANRFAFEMTYGILKGGDVKTISIGRALDEPIGLNNTVKRLYNNNTKSDFSEVLEQAVLNPT